MIGSEPAECKERIETAPSELRVRRRLGVAGSKSEREIIASGKGRQKLLHAGKHLERASELQLPGQVRDVALQNLADDLVIGGHPMARKPLGNDPWIGAARKLHAFEARAVIASKNLSERQLQSSPSCAAGAQ